MADIKTFSESEECKSRLHCLACRSNNKFKEIMINRYKLSDIVCPLNIPLDIKFNDLPDEVKKARFAHIEELRDKVSNPQKTSIENQNINTQKSIDGLKKMKQLKTLIEDNNEATTLVNDIFKMYFGNYKNAKNCCFSGDVTEQVDQVCCGGTIKKVNQYACSKNETTTDKKCMTCDKFCLRGESTESND